jgi:hypothetical protein
VTDRVVGRALTAALVGAALVTGAGAVAVVAAPPAGATVPAIAFLGGQATYSEGDAFDVLDVGPPATLTNLDGPGWQGGVFQVAVNSGGTAAEDVLTVASVGSVTVVGDPTVAGATIQVAGVDVGHVTLAGVNGSSLFVTFDGGVPVDDAAATAVLRALAYTNTNAASPSTATRSIGVTVFDADGEQATTNPSVAVVAVNDPPVPHGPASVNATEDLTMALTGISVSDVDAGSSSVTLALTVSSGTLFASSFGGVTQTGSGTASLGLYGSQAAINTFVANSRVFFAPANDDTADGTLTIRAVDNGATGIDPGTTGGPADEEASITVPIHIAARNDPPSIGAPSSIAVIEDTPSTLTGLTVDDVDAGSAAVTATLSVPSGVLAATSGGGVTVGGTSSVRTLVGSTAAITAFIAAGDLTFTPAADSTTPVTLTIVVDDGGNTGLDPGTSGTPTSEAASGGTTLTITPVDDTPVVAVPSTIAVVEDVASALTGFTLADIDAGAGAVQVTLSVPTGTLAATSGGGVTAGGSGTATLVLTGSLANLNAFVAGGHATFRTAADDISTVTLTVTLDDLGRTGLDPGLTGTATTEVDADTVPLVVTPVNDAPVATVPSGLTVDEDTPTPVTGLSVADVDAGGAPAQLTLAVTAGTLSAASTGGVTATGTGTATVTLDGTLSALNAYLAAPHVTYVPAADDTASATLSVSLSDLGASGAGGPQQDDRTVPITFNPFDDAPVLTTPASIAADQTFPAALDTLSVADVDAGSAPLTLALVVSAGTLGAATTGGVTATGDGTAHVTLVGTLAALNGYLAAGEATYTAADPVGATLTVTVDDGGATGAGGPLTDNATIALVVTPVATTPTFLVIDPRDGVVDLAWTAATPLPGATVTGYRVVITAGDGGPAVGVTGGTVRPTDVGTTLTVTGLTNGTAYAFTVVALAHGGAGVPTARTAAVTPRAEGTGGDRAHPRTGYWMLGRDGAVHAFGGAELHGSAYGRLARGRTTVDLEPTPSGNGYWIVDDVGTVRAYGDAVSLGSLPAGWLKAGEAVTTISATPTGAGYRIATNTGRVQAFGDAAFLGDLAALRLNGSVVSAVTTPSGQGYYLVAADGGVFAFGDARFAGSMGGHRLNSPVVGVVADPDGRGYWLVAADGGVFGFDAAFHGSMGGTRLNAAMAGMAAYGDGYLLVAVDGGVFSFSDLPFADSLPGRRVRPTAPIGSIAGLDGPAAEG